jgi:hypothetical protein
MQTFNLTGISFMPIRYNRVCMMRVHLLADFIWLSAYLITAIRQFEWPLFFHPCFKNIIRLPYFTKFHLCSLLSLQSVNTVYWFLFWIVAFISKSINRFTAFCRLITQSISPTHGFSSLQVQCHLNRPSLFLGAYDWLQVEIETSYSHVWVMHVHIVANLMCLSTYLKSAVTHFEWLLFFHTQTV